jgi:hypothetical protein
VAHAPEAQYNIKRRTRASAFSLFFLLLMWKRKKQKKQPKTQI